MRAGLGRHYDLGSPPSVLCVGGAQYNFEFVDYIGVDMAWRFNAGTAVGFTNIYSTPKHGDVRLCINYYLVVSQQEMVVFQIESMAI